MASPLPASPPPPPPQNRVDTAPEYYFFVLCMGAIAIMLVLSNIVVFACCSPCQVVQTLRSLFRRSGAVAGGRSRELIPLSKYRKDQAYDTDCSVCLTGFTEGEEVRQLPGCRHSFHAPCIDMWLYSHSSCPLCRATVAGLPPPQRCPRAAAAGQDRRPQRPLFTESRNMGLEVIAIM